MVVVVAADHRFPAADAGGKTWSNISSTRPILLFVVLFLAGAVACLVCAAQTDRSMLGDSKEKVGAERNLLDVLWSYCMMEKAAGWVL